MAPITSSENPYRRQLDGIRSARHPAKRLKSEHDSSCSDRSTVSDDSALIRTSVPPESTDNTEADSDDSSELSESSEEPSDESSSEDDEADEEDIPAEEEEVVNLRANRGEKPVMKLKADEEEGDIRSFLKDFLPKLKAANEELEAQKKSGTLKKSEIEQDEVEDTEKQYIEMVSGYILSGYLLKASSTYHSWHVSGHLYAN